jgi:hypothetical protein
LHTPIIAHLLRRAHHQNFALVHHGHAPREPKHAIDIVLDDQHRNVRGHVFHEVGDALAFGRR